MTLDVVGPSRSADRRLALRRPEGVAAALTAFAPVVGLAAAQGGFFPGAWGWATFPLLWLAALALALRDRIRLSGPEKVLLGLLLALTALDLAFGDVVGRTRRQHPRVATWPALRCRSCSRPARLQESRRSAVARRIARGDLRDRRIQSCDSPPAGPGRRLRRNLRLPSSSTDRLLERPCDLHGNGRAGRPGLREPRPLAGRPCGSAQAPLSYLLPTFYFTFGRGAWIALAAGAFTAVAVDPRRLQLLASMLVLSPAPAVAVWVASREAWPHTCRRGVRPCGPRRSPARSRPALACGCQRRVGSRFRIGRASLRAGSLGTAGFRRGNCVGRRCRPCWCPRPLRRAHDTCAQGLPGLQRAAPSRSEQPEQTVAQLFRKRPRGPLAGRLGRRQEPRRARRGRGNVRALFSRASAVGGQPGARRARPLHRDAGGARADRAHPAAWRPRGPVDGSGAGPQASARSGSGRRVRGISRSHGCRLGLGAARGHSRRAPLRRGHSRRSAALVSARLGSRLRLDGQVSSSSSSLPALQR